MMLNKKGLFLYKIFSLFTIAVSLVSCAVQQKPSGGPRDVAPPKLLKATPANLTHNFKSKIIQLDFDEYFKLTNQFQEINVSPAQERAPIYRKKNKSLVIELKDTLLKNTTYVINFGKAISDVNEGNLLKNFTYVFSTGTHIDSLSLAGNVINTLTQLKEKDATVMLFTLKQDSLLFGKKRPPIFTTTDTAGNFTLSNLHEGIYKLYALKETAANKIYDNENELIGFPTKLINLQSDTTGIQMKIFKQVPTKFRFVDRRFDLDGKVLLTFNKPLNNPSVHVLYPTNLEDDKYVNISKTRDTAKIYFKNMDFDSLRLVVNDGNKPVDTVSLHKGRKETYTHNLTLGTNADLGNLLKPGIDLNINTSSPITAVDQSLITLMEDSTAVSNYVVSQDSVNLAHLTLKYRWKQGPTYILTMNEGALTGIFGDKNKKTIKRFKIDKLTNYTQLKLKVTVPDTSKAYIVQLLNDQGQLLRTDLIRKNTDLLYKNYLAARYRVKVIYDDNKNGQWDPGNIKENRQPENIYLLKDVITLRYNLDAEQDLVIPKEINL